MIKAAVLGSPIAHSLSPKIHNKALDILGLRGIYQSFEVNESEFAGFLSKHSFDEWSGFSLTMPLKESVFGVISEMDETRVRINSANTIYQKDGLWKATSTDLLAFDNLAKVSRDSRVVIIGAGGTARAAIGSLNNRVNSVDVLLRNSNRRSAMQKAAPKLKINFLEISAPIDSYDLVIQTTPTGAYDSFAEQVTNPAGTLIEALYKPFPTPLVTKFLDKSREVISGKELLVEQALFQIELFTGAKVDFDQMRTALLAEIAQD